MSLRLPSPSSPLREMFDVADVVPFGMPGGMMKAPTFTECRIGAAKFFAGEPAASAVNSICLRASGALELVQFGPRGGVRTLWRFA